MQLISIQILIQIIKIDQTLFKIVNTINKVEVKTYHQNLHIENIQLPTLMI